MPKDVARALGIKGSETQRGEGFAALTSPCGLLFAKCRMQ